MTHGLRDDKYVNSLVCSLVLGSINLFGYVIVVTFLGLTEVPIIIRQLDDYVEACYENTDMRKADYRDLGAFTWWGVTLVFNIMFTLMHR